MVSKNKSILVISFSLLSSDPRVYRQLKFLQETEYSITAVGFDDPEIEKIDFIPAFKDSNKRLVERVGNVVNLKLKRFDQYYWSSKTVEDIFKVLALKNYNLIITNDMNTLPLAVRLASESGASLLLDAHEYQPRQFDDRWLFRFFFQDYWDYICRKYLPNTDAMFTVCQGIAKEYYDVYGIDCNVLTNAPFYESLTPSNVSDTDVRMIYHGFLNSSRKIENMIYLMDLLDDRFTLDLMVIPNQKGYLENIEKLVSSRERIKFRDPVPMPQISKTLNEYDIGLFLLWPESFNYRMALPNKLFEYIQGCLAVAIWPSQEMARVVHEYNCGVVSDDFTLESMAKVLNNLSTEEIKKFKENSRIASPHLCAEKNRDILLDTVASLISD